MAKLLVVDDAPDSLAFLVMALQLDGHEVTGAASGEGAVEAYGAALKSGAGFDLVVLDLAMPGMNGFEAADRIFGLDQGARVVFLTAFDEPLSVGRAEVSGALAIWGKPVEGNALRTKVLEILATDGHIQ